MKKILLSFKDILLDVEGVKIDLLFEEFIDLLSRSNEKYTIYLHNATLFNEKRYKKKNIIFKTKQSEDVDFKINFKDQKIYKQKIPHTLDKIDLIDMHLFLIIAFLFISESKDAFSIDKVKQNVYVSKVVEIERYIYNEKGTIKINNFDSLHSIFLQISNYI